MRTRWLTVSGVATLLLMACLVQAAITPEQRKEIADLRKEIGKVQGLITDKELDEARKILDEAETKLKGIASTAKVPETDRSLAPLFLMVQQKRAILDKKAAGPGNKGGISFEKEVAPILAAKCMNCHNEDRSAGGLKLDNFAGMEAGGENGALLVPGNAANSQLVRRLTATGNARMPRNAAALSTAEINTIGSWVNQGAAFDGTDKATKFNARPGAGAMPRDNTPVTITRASGDEKVSFTKDIAPFLVNLCLNCHSGQNPRGGLSLVTFESLMKGGQSGRVIIPGNREGSRFFRLVGGLDLPRMPQGQARITRKNYEDMITWFDEGNKFDGPDPKTPLRQLVPTEAEIAAERLSKLSSEEFHAMRKEQAETLWKSANPKLEAASVESNDFIVYGGVGEERLKEIQGWADEYAQTLRSTFSLKDDQLWKGKLIVFVFSDRFSYEEFPRVNEEQEVPRETIGHSRVTPGQENAYICLEDVGDAATSDNPGLKLSLIDHITGAFLKRKGPELPDWVIRGTGLALAGQADKKNEYIQNLGGTAVTALQGLESPEQVFEKGKFPSSDMGPIGYTLVQHFMIAGGPAKFGQMIDKLQSGQAFDAALRSTYNADVKTIGLSYLNSLGSKRPATKSKKK